MGTIITVAILVVIIVTIVRLVRKIVEMGQGAGYQMREARNQVRAMSGKDTVEHDKAEELLNKYSKGGLLPKCITAEAIKVLSKYYDEGESRYAVSDYVNLNNMRCVDMPREFLVEPGAAKELLESTCMRYFGKFDMKGMEAEGAMTEKDFTTFEHLTHMWYFADASVNSLEEASAEVRGVFAKFCAEQQFGMSGS